MPWANLSFHWLLSSRGGRWWQTWRFLRTDGAAINAKLLMLEGVLFDCDAPRL
jgi:hypothetical protein